jgi:hydrogenase expression/formation protein HypD
VSVIIGWEAYREIADAYHIPCVVAGFEPVDILAAVHELVRRMQNGEAGVANAYPRAVTREGNKEARRIMNTVFEPVDAEWRGIGTIPQSGLGFRRPYRRFDALEAFEVELRPVPDPPGCRCG